MALELTEFLQGSFNVIFVLISIAVGLKILSRYFRYKKIHFILVGIIWIGISTPWLHGAITFIIYFFDPLLIETAEFITIRFIIGYTSIPIITTLWFVVFTDLMYQKEKRFLIWLYALISVICECLFFIFLFTNQYDLIGYFSGPFTGVYRPFTRFSLLFFLGSSLVSFLMFATSSLKSENPEIRLKGKFLIIAFLTYTVCAVLDSFAFFLTQPIMVVLIRIFLMLSAIEFYFGWILPDFIKKIFIKSE